jgi:hypothetical protein
MLTQAYLEADEGTVTARWGSLPANATYDPDNVEPLAKPSWVIDLDIFTSVARGFLRCNIPRRCIIHPHMEIS